MALIVSALKRLRCRFPAYSALASRMSGYGALCCLAFCNASGAVAQEFTISEAGTVSSIPDDSPDKLPVPTDRLAIKTNSHGGHVCKPLILNRDAANTPLGCPFAPTSLGLDVTQKLELPDGEIALNIGWARGSDAGLSLRRQMTRVGPGTIRETTLGSLGSSVNLFDGRLKIENRFSWSRNWQTPIQATELQPMRNDEAVGFSQAFKVKALVVDSGELHWDVTGQYSRVSEDFRLENVSNVGQMTAQPGSTTRFSSRLNYGKLRLTGSQSSRRSDFYTSDVIRMGASRSGLGASFSRRNSATKPQSQFSQSHSRSQLDRVEVDLDLYELAPMAAMDDTGWKAFLPKQFTIAYDKRQSARLGLPTSAHTQTQAVDIFGQWTTPLGDTLLSYRREKSQAGSGTSRGEQIFATHSFDIDDWDLSFDVLTMTDSTLSGENDRTTFYSSSIAYKPKQGAIFKFKAGHDTINFGDRNSDFMLIDKAVKFEASLDMSPVLQKKFDRTDIHLALDLQTSLSQSSYELRFLDELLDHETEGYSRHGILLSFRMDI